MTHNTQQRSYSARSFRVAQNRLLVFNEPTSQRISTPLACEIGLIPSIVLLQLEFDIVTRGEMIDNRLWLRTAPDDLHEVLPYIPVSSIKRALAYLVKIGALEVQNYNEVKTDRTFWYAVNRDMKLKSVAVKMVQPIEEMADGSVDVGDELGCTMQSANMHHARCITQETDENDEVVNHAKCINAPMQSANMNFPIRNARESLSKELEKSEEESSSQHDFLRNPSDIPPPIEMALRKVKAIGLVVGPKEKAQWAEFSTALLEDCGNNFEAAAAEIVKRFGPGAWKMPTPPRLSQIGTDWERQCQRSAYIDEQDDPNIVGSRAYTEQIFREHEAHAAKVMAEREAERAAGIKSVVVNE